MKKHLRISANRLIKFTAIALISLSGASIMSTNVSASTGSGGADGSGQGGAGSYWQAWGAGKKSAWEVFVARVISSGESDAHSNAKQIESAVKNAGAKHGATGSQFLNICQNSEFIWYYGPSNYSTRWYTQASNLDAPGMRAGWKTKNGANWSKASREASTEWKQYKAWDNKKPKGNRYEAGNTIIMCSGSFKPKVVTKSDYQENTEESTDTLTADYSYVTNFIPLKTQNYNSYSAAGKNEWNAIREDQTTGTKKTEFGKWYDKNINAVKALDSQTGATHTNNKKKLLDGAKAAIAKDEKSGIPNVTVKPSAKNAKGFNSGTAFNTVQGKAPATFSVGTSRKTERKGTYTITTDANGKETRSGTVWGPWTEVSVGKYGDVFNEINMLTQYRFQQISNSNCNVPGVERAKNSEGGMSMKYGNDTSQSASLSSKNYANNRTLPLGNAAHANANLKASGYDPFFNGEGCGGDPTPEPTIDPGLIDCITSPGSALSGSDAKANKQDENGFNPVKGKFGAQNISNGKKLSSDKFGFFRDGVLRDVRLDIWYAKANGKKQQQPYLVSSDTQITSTRADKTTVFVDPNGTPDGEMTTIKVNGTELSGEVKAGTKPYTVSGELNKIAASGSWASESNKPQRINASWDYTAKQTNKYEWYEDVITGVDLVPNGSGGYDLSFTWGKEWFSKTKTATGPVRCNMVMNTKDPQKPEGPKKDANGKWYLTNQTSFNAGANRSVMFDYVRSAAGMN